MSRLDIYSDWSRRNGSSDFSLCLSVLVTILLAIKPSGQWRGCQARSGSGSQKSTLVAHSTQSSNSQAGCHAASSHRHWTVDMRLLMQHIRLPTSPQRPSSIERSGANATAYATTRITNWKTDTVPLRIEVEGPRGAPVRESGTGTRHAARLLGPHELGIITMAVTAPGRGRCQVAT